MPDNDALYQQPTGGTTIPIAVDDIGGIRYQRIKVGHGTDGSYADVSDSAPLPVRTAVTGTPVLSHTSQSNVAKGASASLDSPQVSNGKTARLQQLIVSASVPVKIEVRTVSNGVASANRVVWFTGTERGWIWNPPSRDFLTVSHDAAAGLDGFRAVVTHNGHTANAADVYATWLYTED